MKTSNNPLDLKLWLVDPSTIRSMPLLTRYYETLNASERERHSRFTTPRLKHDFLVTRAFVRDLLSRTVENAISPHEWMFSENKFGRPSVSNPAFKGKLHFNLSHTDNLIACIVGPIYEIGVDVENQARKIDCISLAEDCFSKPEYGDLLRQTTPETIRRRFFEYWTLKEAYIKARGMGLSIPIEHFNYNIAYLPTGSGRIDNAASSLRPVHSNVSIRFEAPIIDSPHEWQFKLFQLPPNHMVSVAAKSGGRNIHIQSQFLTPLANTHDEAA